MRTTATQLATYFTCPFLWHVSYGVKEPLPVWGTRRRFGNVIHAAIAEYEHRGRSLEHALRVSEAERAGITPQDLEEARSILVWRHERALERGGRLVLVEGSLRAHLGGHSLDVRMDRLDRVGSEYLLAEYKGGKTVDLELVRVQLLILSYAVWDVFGRTPSFWEVEFLRARKLHSLPAEVDPGRLREFIWRLIQGIENGDRDSRPYNPRFCARCPARPWCSRVTDTPRPFSKTAAGPGKVQLELFGQTIFATERTAPAPLKRIPFV